MRLSAGRITIYLIAIVSIFITNSCINIRTPYPEISYYQLEQMQSVVSKSLDLDAVLQIRDVVPAEHICTDHLFAMWDNKNIRKYFYHRWVSDVPYLIGDFFKQRYSNFNSFKKGVVNSSSVLNPDYFLELRLLDFNCFSSDDDEKDSTYVTVSMQAVFSKRDPDSSEPKVLMSQTFNTSAKRGNNDISSIAPAFSKAVSEISDLIFIEFFMALTGK